MGEDNQLEPVAFDPKDTLVSDAEREHIAGLLQQAVGQGVLTLEEFAARTDRALVARTRGELDRVVVDLPGHTRVTTTTDRPLTLHTSGGTAKQVGHWVVPSHIVAECGMGTVRIDFTEASCAHRDVTLKASCGAGSIRAIVPPGWLVQMEEVHTGMGAVVNRATAPADSSMPVLHVYAKTGMGAVTIAHPRKPGFGSLVREWFGIRQR